MRISFQLSDDDLKYFRRVMKDVRDKMNDLGEEQIISSTRDLLESASQSKLPDFISERILKLKQLVDMLEDEEWALKGRDRERVLRGMAYFAEPDDMIPDKIPVIGFLDDAIMVELVVMELEAELEAYSDFCEFRTKHEDRFGMDEDPATREEWVVARRTQLHQRMRRRRSRRRSTARTSGAKGPISLW